MKLGRWPALIAVAVFAVLLWPGELGPRPWWLFVAAVTLAVVGCAVIFRRLMERRRDTPP